MERQVLIIDDDELDRMSYMRELNRQQQGAYRFIEAATALEALTLCETTTPDCILIDYNLPGLNGVELVDVLKDRELCQGSGIIFLTGQGNERIAVEAMKRGAHDYLSKSQITGDMLNRAIDSAVQQTQISKQLEHKTQIIEHLAYRDPLTGLLNKIAFEESLRQALAGAKRHQHRLALLFIDLDHFKNVNDTMGHDIGDLLLKEVCVRMRDCLREEDVIARLGGDEFAVVINHLPHRDEAGVVAQKIIDALMEKFNLNGKEAHIGASIGITTYPESESAVMELLKYADIAMYHAKALGRNTYQYFSPQLHQQHIRDMELENALHFAIERGQLYLEYQPQYSLSNGEMIGMEALLRWEHPQMGYIPPDKLFEVAEESGLSPCIGRWIVSKACYEFSQILNQTQSDLSLSINISPRQMSNAMFINAFKEAIAESRLNPSSIEIELTEAAITDDVDKTKASLDALRGLGVRIGIDDFGTGYSSLMQLKHYLPINTIKIDKSFIQNVTEDENDERITLSILDIANNLNLRAIAEGVETQAQVDFLKQAGCMFAQGYHFAHPMRASKISELLKAGREAFDLPCRNQSGDHFRK